MRARPEFDENPRRLYGKFHRRAPIKRCEPFYNMTGSLISSIKDSLDEPGLIGALGRPLYRGYNLLRETLIPSLRRARRLDHEFDSKFGVITKACISLDELEMTGGNAKFGAFYEAIRPTEFDEVISCIRIRHEEFFFIDFGSGMGRALLLASELPFKKIVGVEFSRRLHRTAMENLCKYKSESQKCLDIESICMDATQYQIPREKAVFFFYNPFKGEVMAKVLDNIRKSLEKNPREAFILYYNPVCIELFEGTAFEELKVAKRYAAFRFPVEVGQPA
jgi:SAM-dependent methyltransferase